MKAYEKTLLYIAAFAIAFAASRQRGCELPSPIPQPVDSPFPAEGFWLLVASESEHLDGSVAVANAKAIRDIPGLENRWFDYHKSVTEPWQAALDWCEDKSGGKAYFVARKGNKAAEGPLTGTSDEQLATILAALEGLE